MFTVNDKDRVNIIVNSEHIFTHCSSVSIVNFEQVNAGWGYCLFQQGNPFTRFNSNI